MSLQVWLPLNGDLKNQGCSNPNISLASGNTWASSGKIGNSSLTLTKLQTILPTSSCMTGAKEVSYCYWVKVNTAWSANWLDGIRWIETNGSATSTARQEFYTNCTLVGTWYKGGSIAGKAFTPGTWTHLAATFNYNTGEANFYIDGILKGTTTNIDKTYYCRGDFYIGDNGVDICQNDVRIYDHALSAAEVKEISQGLVLHYKLDQNITVGENIMPNSLDMPLGSANPTTGTWRTAGSNNMTRSRVAITDTPEGSGYGFQNSGIQTANDGSCYGIDNFPTEANTEYVISMWARITAGTEGYAGFAIQRATPIAGWQVINKNYYSTRLASDGSWTKCWISFKTNTATTRNIYIGITTGDTSVTTQMCNVHIEKGSLVDSNIIKDSSGYNYNGTITGNTEITFNSARYYQALNYDGGYIDTNMELNTTNSTISIWLNIPSLSTSYHILDARNSSGTGKQPIYSYSNGSIQTGGSGKYVTSNSNFLETNKWIFIAIVQDENNILLYKNGTLFQTIACTNTSLIKPTIGARYTLSNIYHGQMSDFRIYCTALSADDILSLYRTSAKVDNKQNFHTFELIENNSGIKINKCGQTLCNELEENTATKFYKTNQIIETNEIIEL